MGSVDLRSRALGDAGLLAVGRDRRADARRLLLLGIDQRDVGDVDRARPLDHADLRVRVQRRRALVALLQVEAVDVDALGLAVHADDAAGLAAVLAADDDHLVVATDLELGALALHELEHLRSKRDDLHEPAVAQLAGHRPEDARPARVVGLVDDHRGVLVEADVRAVVATEGLLRAHDDRADDLALLDRALRRRLLDGRGDDVTHARVAALVPADDADAEDLPRARVVSHAQPCLVLDHELLRPLQDLDEPPALEARQRAGLDDLHEVALAGVVVLVVGVQRRARAHDLLVAAVPARGLDADGDGLVGLVGDDAALAHLLAPGRPGDGLGRRGLRALGALGLLLGAAARALGGELLAALVAGGLALLGRARLALGRLGVARGGALLLLGALRRG